MIWSCLQGVMGDLYTDDTGDSAASSKASSKISGPETAKAVLGDFIFLAGKPSEELLLHQPPCRAAKKAEFQILVPKDAGWERLIEKVYGSRAEKNHTLWDQKGTGCLGRGRKRETAGDGGGTSGGI